MKRVFSLLFFLGIVLNSIAQNVYYDYQDGLVVFQLKHSAKIIPSNGKEVDFRAHDIFNRLSGLSVVEILRLHPDIKDENLRRTYQIKLSNPVEVDEVIRRMKKSPDVQFAELKELHRTFLTPNDLGPNTTNTSGTSPSNNQWALWRIQAQQAWDLGTGDANIIVAVTDDAILTTHPDLQNKLVLPHDATTGTNNPNPCGSNNGNHGTHVSGTVGAQTNNGVGVASIGFNVSVMPVKIGNCNNQLTHGFDGIIYAADNGAHVINMSWGGGGFSNYGQNVCNYAWNQGSILVAAAGNNNQSTVFYPAGYNNVIAVASTTPTDAKSSFSQFGTWINISAPGSNIRSTYATSAYASISGTSMASPHVAGLVGLLKATAPNATNTDIINCLYSGADDISAQNPSYPGQLGVGRINAYNSMQCAVQFAVQLDAAIVDVINPGSTVCGNSFIPQVVLRNFGGNTLNSATITYNWNGTPATFNWTGSLPTGQTTTVSLPNQVAANGSYTFTAATSNPNGQADQNPANDSFSKAFIVDQDGQTVDLTIVLDCYGSEVGWNVVNDNGTVVASGGGYPDGQGGAVIEESFCLPVGCYTFNITDTYGDGMFGSQWQGCSVNGNYFMEDESGAILFQMTAVNANYGFGTSHQFCITAPNNMNDAGIVSIVSPSNFNCGTSFDPQVTLRNFGSAPLTSVTINYQTSGAPQQFAWTGNLASGQSQVVTLPSITSANGVTSFTSFTSNPNGTTDDNPNNDQAQSTFNILGSAATLPFVETFETNVFTNGTWSRVNPDNDFTWELATVGGITPGSQAAKMDFFNYAVPGQRDGLVSPRINLAGYTTAQMTFDHAYRRFDQSATDSLIIKISTDCGASWTREFAVAENGTGTFATQTTNSNPFTPAQAVDWCFEQVIINGNPVGALCYVINLDDYVGQEILVMFEAYNAGTVGNNLYIDNINIDGTASASPPIPNFSVNSNSICEGGTVQFTDLSTANITSWSWSFPGGSPATSTAQNPTVTYAAAGTYDVTLTVTNSFGTETITTTNAVTVNTLPVVSVVATNMEVCAGTSTQLTASGANSYTWDNGLGAGATKTVSPNQTTTYTVTGSNGAGCSTTQSITITVVPAPTVVASANQTSICAGQSVDLSASGASSYTWNNGLGGGATHSVMPTQTTIYTVTGSNGGNCQATASITITVNTQPVVTVNASALTICEGDQVSLAANGANTYTWTPTAGLSSSTGASITASPTTTTTYTVTGSNNCGTDTETITVFVNPVPSTPVITQTGNDLSVTLQPGESAMWYFNGNFIGNGPVITMTGNGNYEVVITNNSDCSASTSGEFEMDTTSLNEEEMGSLISLYPNPNNGMFELIYSGFGDAQAWVTDALGRRITSTEQLTSTNDKIQFNLTHCQKGVYFVIIETEGRMISRKVTIN
jgi:subtilisin family serine protease